MRDFVFYTRDPAAAKATIEELQAAKTAHEIQDYVAEEAKWEVYKGFA